MKSMILITAGLSLLASGCHNKTPSAPATPTPPETVKNIESENSQLENTKAAIVAKMLTSPSGNLETLDSVLEKLMGEWHQSAENFSPETKTWMKKNNITDFYDTFSWGTDKGWIKFGDFRTVNGKPKQTGTGMVSWHSGYKHLPFREAGSRGGFVDGMIEIKDEFTFIRHYQFYNPKGHVSYSSDKWSFTPDDLSCFMWQTTSYKDGVPTSYPARKFCKK